MLTSTTIRTTCQLENCSCTVPFSSTLTVSNQNMIFQSNFKLAPSFFFFLAAFSVRLCLHSILRSPTSWLIFFNVHILKFTFCVGKFFVLYQIHSIRYPPLQNIISTLQVPMCPLQQTAVHSPRPSQPLTCFSVLLVSPFVECHMKRIA